MMTCTSLRMSLANSGRSGRSVRRAVRMASSVGRPSRRKNEPGMRPPAYMRSSYSTESGKKSMPGTGIVAHGGGGENHRIAELNGDCAASLPGQFAGFKYDLFPADLGGEFLSLLFHNSPKIYLPPGQELTAAANHIPGDLVIGRYQPLTRGSTKTGLSLTSSPTGPDEPGE